MTTEKVQAAAPNPLKALDILEGLAQGPKGAGVSELAEMTQLSKSSVYRILMALVQRQYVVKDDHAKVYQLGFRPLSLASAVLDSLEIKHIARSELRHISDATGETVHLMCLDGMEAVYVDKIETPNPIGLKSQIGKRLPLYCTSGGKALLAHNSEQFIQHYMGSTQLIQCTPKTLTTPQALMEELERIRRQGYALDDEEHHINITCIAVPILNHRQEIQASISIAAPSYRFSVQQALKYKDLLMASAQSIAMQLL